MVLHSLRFFETFEERTGGRSRLARFAEGRPIQGTYGDGLMS